MSIVPYRALETGRIVYHDPTSQILVVHNNHNNSVELYDSYDGNLNGVNYPPLGSVGPLQPQIRRRNGSPHSTPCCPNCGVDLTEFLEGKTGKSTFSGRQRTLSNPRRNRPRSFHGETTSENDENGVFPYSVDLRPVQFMHRDYFDLLAELPFDVDMGPGSRALEGPNAPKITEDSASSEIFNQGYFLRFFRKIPPGILGSGAHAQVYKVAHMLKGIQLGVFAVKRINVGDHLHFLDQVLNEVLILYELSAKGANEYNLIRYNHVWMEYGDLTDLATYILNPDSQEESVQKVPYVYILQQYCDGGHLENMISSHFLREESMSIKERIAEERKRRRDKRGDPNHSSCEVSKKWLSDVEIWKFFYDIANGVAYLHSHGILHRDLKPSNCLLESKFEPEKYTKTEGPYTEDEFEGILSALPKVLVSDFGEGKFLNKKQKPHMAFPINEERRGNTGTLEFTDPKLWLFEDVKNYDGKPKFAHQFTYDSDIYSLGMILCFLCVGKLPFADFITDFTNPEAVREEIAAWHASLTPEKFNQWFDERTLFLKGKLSPLLEDFRLLVYLMVKGQPNTAKPSPKTFIECLDSIKWRRFILQRNRSRSEATIVEMNNLSAFKSSAESDPITRDEDPDEEDLLETIDLTDLEDEPTVVATPEVRKFTRVPSLYKLFLIRSGYIFNLVLLEALSPPKYSWWISCLKLGNVLSLTLENFYCNDYRMQLVIFWSCLSYLALYYL